VHAQTQAAPPSDAKTPPARTDDGTFKLGEIVYVLGKDPGSPGIGGSEISREQLRTFERNSLDQAVNLVPGVVATFDANGRRNELDIFVRGFGRQQVPLMVDGVRIYLPADNRLDFARFLTADVAAIQIQKGYASVIDGPGAMGGAINLVTMKPGKAFEAEGGLSAAGRGIEGWNASAIRRIAPAEVLRPEQPGAVGSRFVVAVEQLRTDGLVAAAKRRTPRLGHRRLACQRQVRVHAERDQ
jgi:outer membrane receptor protein involved in Fe transport